MESPLGSWHGYGNCADSWCLQSTMPHRDSHSLQRPYVSLLYLVVRECHGECSCTGHVPVAAEATGGWTSQPKRRVVSGAGDTAMARRHCPSGAIAAKEEAKPKMCPECKTMHGVANAKCTCGHEFMVDMYSKPREKIGEKMTLRCVRSARQCMGV